MVILHFMMVKMWYFLCFLSDTDKISQHMLKKLRIFFGLYYIFPYQVSNLTVFYLHTDLLFQRRTCAVEVANLYANKI